MGMDEKLAKALNESFGRTGRRQVEQQLKDGKLKLITATDKSSGNDRFLLEKQESIPLGNEKYLMNGKIITTNPMRLGRRVFNKMNCEIYWRNMDENNPKRPHIIHPAQTWIDVPDHYYVPHLKKDFSDKGAKIDVIEKMLCNK